MNRASRRVDKNYLTKNPAIRWLIGRLLKRITYLLREISAVELNGLDVGCGEGNILRYVYRHRTAGQITAIDLNERKIRVAQHHSPSNRYVLANVNRLSFKRESFEYILVNEVFEHLAKPVQAMQEIMRVAKKHAYIVVSVPHEPFFSWGNLIRGKYWGRWGHTPAHCHFWNRRQFRQFLTGFVEIEKEYTTETFPWLLYLCRLK